MREARIIGDGKLGKLNIDKDAVSHYLGYSRKKGKEPPQNILQIIEEEVNRGYELFKPQGVYRWIKIYRFIREEEVELEEGQLFKFTKSVMEQLKGATYLLVGVVTIGDFLEKKVAELFSQTEYVRALALDAVGSVAVEDFSRKVRKLARQEAIEQGFKVSRRHYSPGYGGWEVSQQRVIFQIISPDSIGVKLTEGNMMFPQKSLSWVMGVDQEIAGPIL